MYEDNIRKVGLSLILSAQTTSNFNQEQRDRLFQAGHKLFSSRPIPRSNEIYLESSV